MIIPKNPYKILLLEEKKNGLLLQANWLRAYGEVIHEAYENFNTLMAQPEIWDLVVSDVEPTDHKGLNIIKVTKFIDPWIPVLIITDYEALKYNVKALHHADGLLFKPLEKTTFLDLALKLTAESRQKRQQEQKVVLAIGAHPDDVEIGCGGCLIHHHSQGDLVNILTLSRGEAGGNGSARVKESQIAAQLLQAQLFMGDLSDTHISDGASTIHLIEEIISQIQPTHIYTHSQHDDHQDHRHTYLASIVACRKISNFYCFQSPSSTIDFKPHLFVDISQQIAQKIKVLSLYQSQMHRGPYLHEEMIRASALYWGRFMNYGLVEPMEVIRQQYK
jgi:LmbE family N-acetylglucosaminyl deacetylase